MVTQVADLCRVTWQFGLFEGVTQEEIADMSCWFKSDHVPTLSTTWESVLLDMATVAYEAWKSNADANSYHTSVVLLSVKATHCNTNGTTQQEQVYAPSGSDQWKGGASAKSLPWQLSLVVSLYSYTRGTFVQNQRQKRGRMYLPPMSSGALQDGDSGLLDITNAHNLAEQLAVTLQAIQDHTYSDETDFEPIPGVNSRGPFKAPGTPPAFYPYVEVSVDNKLDTQRRRSKQLAGAISSFDYPPA